MPPAGSATVLDPDPSILDPKIQISGVAPVHLHLNPSTNRYKIQNSLYSLYNDYVGTCNDVMCELWILAKLVQTSTH